MVVKSFLKIIWGLKIISQKSKVGEIVVRIQALFIMRSTQRMHCLLVVHSVHRVHGSVVVSRPTPLSQQSYAVAGVKTGSLSMKPPPSALVMLTVLSVQVARPSQV